MSFHCANCGSPNHKAMDCSKPPGTWTPPPPAPIPAAPILSAHAREASFVSEARPGEFGPKLLAATWPGGPEICSKEMLPAFADERAGSKFLDSICVPLDKKWACAHCGMWHFRGKDKAPTGTSNGGGRENNLPRNFRPFMRQSTIQMLDRQDQERRRTGFRPQELPEQAQPAAEAPRPAFKAPEPKKQQPKMMPVEGGLF